MSPLLALPNELIYHIINQIHPSDILNFSLTCEKIHSLAGDALSLHQRRKGIYQNVVLHGCHRHSPNLHPLRLIRDICMDWRVAEYAKSLTFQCCQYPGHPNLSAWFEDEDEESEEWKEDEREYEDAKDEDDEVVETIMKKIQDYIAEKALNLGVPFQDQVERIPTSGGSGVYLSDFDVEASCSLASDGNREAMLVLLLLFLPNLETLSLGHCTWAAHYLDSAVNWIAQQYLSPRSRNNQPLTQLSTVRLLGSSSAAHGEDFESFMAFAALSSVRTLWADYVDGLDNIYSWGYAPHSSNVTEIVLLHSTVNARTLSALLAGLRALKRFTYEYNENAHPEDVQEQSGFQAHKIIGALVEHAGHSLEYLALTGNFEVRDDDDDDVNTNVHHHNSRDDQEGCMQAFNVLKEVILDCSIYVDEGTWMPSLDSDLYGGRYGTLETPVARPLVDILPASIETVRLRGQHVACDVLGLLADLKSRRLPALTRIAVVEEVHSRLGMECERYLVHVCEPLGVTLEVGLEKDQ